MRQGLNWKESLNTSADCVMSGWHEIHLDLDLLYSKMLVMLKTPFVKWMEKGYVGLAFVLSRHVAPFVGAMGQLVVGEVKSATTVVDLVTLHENADQEEAAAVVVVVLDVVQEQGLGPGLEREETIGEVDLEVVLDQKRGLRTILAREVARAPNQEIKNVGGLLRDRDPVSKSLRRGKSRNQDREVVRRLDRVREVLHLPKTVGIRSTRKVTAMTVRTLVTAATMTDEVSISCAHLLLFASVPLQLSKSYGTDRRIKHLFCMRRLNARTF